MPYLTGVALALLTGLLCRLAGFDRDRALYPVVLIVVASYYVLFAAMSGSARTVLVESTQLAMFASVAVVGFRSSLWLVAAGLVGHGIFDVVLHGPLVSNAGVPVWWPGFCGGFDVAIGAFLIWLLRRGSIAARALEPASVRG